MAPQRAPDRAGTSRVEERYVRLAILALCGCVLFACAERGSSDLGDVKIAYFETNTTDSPIEGFVHLRWKIDNAERFELVSVPGSVIIADGRNFEDELDARTTAEDTTFKMIAYGQGGPVVKRVRIDVDDALVHVTSFDASATFAAIGGTVTLSWVTEGADELRIREDEVELFRTSERVQADSHDVVITKREHHFTLEARGMEKTATAEVVVRGDAPPRIEQLEVQPHAFRPNVDSVQVSWRALGDAFDLQGQVANQGSKTLLLSTSTDLTLIASTGSTAIRRTATAFAVEEEREPNDDPQSAQSLALSGATGAIDASTDVDVYAFRVPAGGAVFVETEDGGGGCRADTVVRLLGLGGEELARDDDGGAPLATGLGGCSRIGGVVDLAGGEYRIEVRGSVGPYVLLVRTVAPGCGNGLREANEACDDGNSIEGDGCSAACVFEPMSAPGRTVIVDVGDHRAPSRTIAIDAAPGDSIAVRTETGTETGTNNGAGCDVDLHIALYDAEQNMLGEDVGPGCAVIDPARDAFANDLSGGRYFLTIDNRGGGQGGLVATHVEITTTR